MSAAIEVRDLVIRYGDLEAVAGATFTAPAGAVTAVLGPNGAGKTSTIETLEGFRRPHQGSVRVLGLDPVADHRELVRRVGVMLQDGGVYRAIRVEEAVRLFAAYYEQPRDPDALIDLVGLGHRRRAVWRTLSGGEQQRLSLALALVGDPELVFLDEPTAGLDVAGRRLVHDLVVELAASGVTVVLATHDLAEAETLAHHVVIIDQGHVVAEGDPAQLAAASGPPELRFSVAAAGSRGIAAHGGEIDTAALSAHLGAAVRAAGAGEYVADTPGDPATVARLTAWLAEQGIELGDLRAGRQRLEDTFLRLTAETSVAAATESPSRRRRRR